MVTIDMIATQIPRFTSAAGLARLLNVDRRVVIDRIHRGILQPDAREGTTSLFNVERVPQIREQLRCKKPAILA